MIQGTVNSLGEARIPITLIGNVELTVEAILDTGFTGFLTLSPEIIAQLGFEWLCRERAILGDGQPKAFEVFLGNIRWLGALRPVEVIASGSEPLVGMGLMAGHILRAEIVVGGRVDLSPLWE